jgi:RNA polymerase sigma-70 factor, ECF subfamily
VAGNQCIDALRRRQRGLKVFVEVEEGAAVIEAASSEPSALAAVISTQERAQVRDTIARLPENYRVPLVLRYYGELSYDEIAQELGVERNYVATLIFRAKLELRRKLAHRSK